MSSVKKTPARIKAEKEIYELMDAFDPSKYNSDQYKKLFNTMNEAEFKKYMTRLSKEEEYVSIEIDTSTKKLTLDKIFNICEKLNIKTHKYVMYRENKNSDSSKSSITAYPALILYIPIKRLQQLINKKNSASGNTDKINPLTGTVTSDSKSASITDTQTFGLIVTNQTNSIKELLGPRSDDDVSKKVMLHTIEEYGDVSLNDLKISTENKQSLNTMKVFLKSIGIQVKTGK